MAKVNRNDPCPCGSGKKYKQCHEPIDRAHNDHLRLLRRAMDRLQSKVIEATQDTDLLPALTPALAEYWNDAYSIDQLNELDDLEDRGAERFLTWFAFDAQSAEDGTTLLERLAAAPPEELELDQYELELLPTWTNTRLRPYIVEEIQSGKGATVRDLYRDATFVLRDHAAAKRLEEGELLIVHLVPVAEEHVIAGAAAHITADTREQLEEFLSLQRELWEIDHPDGSVEDFARTQSAKLNHFVMALPREERTSTLDDLMLKGRIALQMAKGSLLGTTYADANDTIDEADGESFDDAARIDENADESSADLNSDAAAHDDTASTHSTAEAEPLHEG